MLLRHPLGAALLLLLAAPVAHAEVTLGQAGGWTFSTEGLLQGDFNRYQPDRRSLDAHPGRGGSRSDHDLRRAEFYLKAEGPAGLDAALGYDPHSERWLDAYGRLRFGADDAQFVQVGQFKQPNSLEELSSTRHNDFIAKAAVTNTFGVARRAGLAWGLDTGDWSVTASVFDRDITSGQAEGRGHGLRGTWAPLNSDTHTLHLGASWIHADLPGGEARLRARPNADLTDTRLIDTGLMADARHQDTLGLEGLWLRGPLKLQGEWYHARIARQTRADFSADGGYVSALWNLTGQDWSYRAGVPRTPSAGDAHAGLWQLGLRLDHLDLDDHARLDPQGGIVGVAGGRMTAWTVGVNWTWRDHLKLMLNYVSVSSDRLEAASGLRLSDDPTIWEARAQLHW